MPLPVKLSFLFRGCAFFKYWEKSSSPCIPYNSSALLLVLVLMVSFGTCFVLSLHLFLGCPLRMEQFPTLFSPPDKSLSYLTAHRNPSAGRPVKCLVKPTSTDGGLLLFVSVLQGRKMEEGGFALVLALAQEQVCRQS